MRLTAIIAFVAVVHIGSDSIAAQQPANGLPPSANAFVNPFAAKRQPASTPRFLFPTPAPTLQQSRNGRLGQKPTVVCGLTLIPGDPNVDPAIKREAPDDSSKFSIGSVEPKVCRQP
jgi:hypothetical protein